MKNQLYGVLGEGGEEKGGGTRRDRKTKGERRGVSVREEGRRKNKEEDEREGYCNTNNFHINVCGIEIETARNGDAHMLIPALGRHRQEGFCDLKTILVYIAREVQATLSYTVKLSSNTTTTTIAESCMAIMI